MTGQPLPPTGERTVPGVASENYWFRRHVAAYRWARRVAGRGRTLDAGSGEGYGTAMLGAVGVELEAGAAAHAARAHPEVGFIRADCCELPIRERSLDAIVCLQAVEHLPCAEGFVAASARVLRPGGRLILSTPNRATFPGGLNPFHIHEFVAEELAGLLGTAYRDVRILGLRHRPPLRALDRVLGEPVQHRLSRVGYEGLPAWARAVLRTVTSRDFRVTDAPEGALDLLAVASGTIAA